MIIGPEWWQNWTSTHPQTEDMPGPTEQKEKEIKKKAELQQ